MAIEIKELHIRVTVNAPQGAGQTGAPPPSAPANSAGDEGDDAKDAIVAECVEQVLEILRNKTGR